MNANAQASIAAAADTLSMTGASIGAVVWTPFALRTGRGRIGAALAALTQQPDLPNPDALAAAGIIPGAVGGEALSTQVSSRFIPYLKCAPESCPAFS